MWCSHEGTHRPNGPTLLKHRQLQAAGWRVVSVPYFEWGGLDSPREQRAYLSRRLAAAGLDVDGRGI